MDREIKTLIDKYASNDLTNSETLKLEKLIENGSIELEDLPGFTDFRALLDDALFQDIEMPDNKQMANLLRELGASEKNHKQRIVPKNQKFHLPLWQIISSGAAILLIGLLGGYLMKDYQDQSRQFEQLSSDVSQMKYQMLYQLREQPLAQERLKAVRLTNELESVDEHIANVLLQTLKSDPNINVRLAALDALIPYADLAYVREGLIKTIPVQDSPIVQLRVVDLMAEIQNSAAFAPLKEWINQQQVPGRYKNDFNNRIAKLNRSNKEI